jgi:hypothetical protein
MQAILLLIGCLTINTVRAMVYDNRFWPLYPEPYMSRQAYYNTTWFLSVRGIFVGADSAYTQLESERDLYGVFGDYDELTIDSALQKIGVITTSLIRPDLRSFDKLPWIAPGKVSLRGAALETEVFMLDWLSCGGSLFIGEEQAHRNAILIGPEMTKLPQADREELIQVDHQLHSLLQLQPPSYHGVLFGDIDLHLGGHLKASYWYKIQQLDCEFRFGVYTPSSERGFLQNPVALPIGGSGHTGLYGQWNLYALLNEDIACGWSLQVCKRLPKTSWQRMPALAEPTNYGAIIAPACVNPGVTVAFNPYVQMGGLREGFGLAIGYFLVHHAQDVWSINQTICEQFQPNIKLLEERSRWGADHFSVTAFYDFGYEKEDGYYRPLISLIVDIPWKGPVTLQTLKSHAISLRCEMRL